MDSSIIRIQMGKSNAYLIRGKNGFVLVDAGMKNKASSIVKALEKMNAQPSDINLIIVTHVHYDHVGSLSKIKKESGALVLVHKKEKDFLSNGHSGFPKGTMFLFKIISKLARKFLRGNFEPVNPDIIVTGELDLDDFGIDGKVIHTPGHTEGSICVIVNKKYCICGDTMFNFLPKSIYPPFADNEEMLVESWKKINKYKCERYYPGHGREFNKGKFKKGLLKSHELS